MAETSRNTPVFKTVRINPVSVPVQAPAQKIPAVSAGTVRYRLHCYYGRTFDVYNYTVYPVHIYDTVGLGVYKAFFLPFLLFFVGDRFLG